MSVLLCVQEVQQRKAAQKEADKLRLELGTLKPQLSAASSRVAELQAANAALRVSVNDLKQRLLLAADGVQQQDGEALAAAALRQQLERSEAEAAGLKQQVTALQQQDAGRNAGAAGEASQQVQALQQQVAVLQQENQELRQELGAFDPAFFEELEDLKHSHHQLQQKAVAQAKLIRQLQNQLSNSSQRMSSSGVGAEGSGGSGVGGRSTRLAP
jgi:chromosome segregation ATPase